ncbi:MAG: PDZ domain-containing protein, partial [Crocinitomicaceae bacterium]|nr:PDZ domain-containing protein [Crocinitomicaceae bacterium]
MNDTFSSTVFYSFIKAIDGGGYFFLNSDIERFQKHQYNIDDQIKARTSTFFDEVAQVYKLRLTSADSILDVLEKETFNFKQKEVLSYHPDHYPDNVNTVIELKERWRKWIQYSILEELFNGDYFDSAIGESTESLMSKIHLAEEEVFAYEHFAIEVYLKNPSGYETELSTFYLDAIATTYDPHTSYFSGVQKEEFIEELSEEKKMFGFSVEEDDKGIIRIYDLVPGSAAWNSNQLNKGDEILSVTLGDGKSIDMQTSKVSDLMLLMSSSKSEELTLEIKKGNGEVLEVELKKSEVYIAEDAIQNAILNGDKKIGYITLPDFYTNWDDDGGLGCANDVARTIVKIQKENISGLILDLRNNGGGSLLEAIDLAGIFIDWGPLAIVHDKNGEATSIKDMNKGAIYTGPLVILVNGLSASASEIITAALQDYNRAIVIGSPTYGKATSQIILPLDPDFIYGVSDINKSDESFGHLKITIGGFYRITNSSHQRSGIIPDIIMPDFYDIY